MNKDFWKKYGGWLVSAVFAMAVSAVVILYEREYYEWNRMGIARMLSDGCFVSGVLLTGAGILMLVSGFGGFDALSYAGHLLLRKFSPFREKFEARASYLEFLRERKKKKKNPGCILGTGVACLLCSAAWLLVYHGG